MTEEEKSHGKMPSLSPKDVSAAVLYAISVKDEVQVIKFYLFSVHFKCQISLVDNRKIPQLIINISTHSFFFSSFHHCQIHEIKIKPVGEFI